MRSVSHHFWAGWLLLLVSGLVCTSIFASYWFLLALVPLYSALVVLQEIRYREGSRDSTIRNRRRWDLEER